ncbi:MAG TPA: glycosyltransferase [Puia sp.]|nr:glycosyltransferase [Puia sp.]
MKAEDGRFIILSPGFPENEKDTVCLPAQQALLTSLGQQFPGLEIVVISFQYPFTTTRYRWKEHLVIPLNGRSKRRLNRLITWIRVWRTLKKLRRERPILGIFSFWCTECALLGERFGKKYHIRSYNWILGQDARESNRFVSLIRPKPESLIAMSPFLAETFFGAHGIRPKHIIPNGIRPQDFPPLNTHRDIDLLGVGSLISLKQYHLFVLTIKALKQDFPDIKSLICGKGQEEENLRKLILDNDLQNNISIIGEVPHPEALQWMNRSRILLHPSSYEGFSTVCLEALYAGAEVISFCDPKIGEIPHWHIARNPEEMNCRARTIMRDKTLTPERITVYTMDESARQIMELYDLQPAGRTALAQK